MDRRHVIWLVLLSVIPEMPAAVEHLDICASCHANATCSNKTGGSGHICECLYGFIGNGRTVCQDKDECAVGAQICGPGASCRNTVGSFLCTCHSGFSPSNGRTAFTPNDGSHCQDVDECERPPAVCGEGARCVNLEGDFECHCLLGYRAHNATEPFQPLRDRGSCRVVDCGRPPTGEAALVLSTNGTTYGSVVLLGCPDGFLWRRGDNSSTCGMDGTWSRSGPVCEEVDCSSPPTPPHTLRLRWDGTSGPGSEVLYRCHLGYQNVGGGTVSVCAPSGQWEVSILCKELSCGAPLRLPGAQLLWIGRSSVGSEVLYLCASGYYHESGPLSAVSKCSETGEWEHVSLNCRARCGLAPSLAHAEVLWANRSVSIHGCVAGYHSSAGSGVSVCGRAGEWQKATLRCRDVDECERPPAVCGEGARCVNLEGDFECHCLLGYRAHNATEPFQPLRDRGSCRVVDCGRPPTGEAALVLSTNGTTYGSVVLLGCPDGFLWRRGDNSSTCGMDGTWSRSGPVCEEVDCGSPTTPPHTLMLRWDGTSGPGSEVLYRCHLGYQNVGGGTVSVCAPSGQWEVSILCKELSCGAPLRLPGAQLLWIGRSSVGSEVLYLCASGYYHESGPLSAISKCSETGEWEHVSLNCRARCGLAPSLAHAEVLWANRSMSIHGCVAGYHSSAGSGVSVCGRAGEWQKATLRCRAVDCGEPPDHPHATAWRRDGSTPGSSVVYRCDPGYQDLRGGNVSVCSASGVWSLARFLCQEIQCGEPFSKPHATMLWDHASHIGSVLFYQCDEGYRASSSKNWSQCGENGRWEESDLRCEELSCGAPLRLPGLQQLWGGRSSVGSEVLYVCPAGYYEESGQPSAVSKCSQTGEWGHVSLTCRAHCGLAPSLAHAEVLWANRSVSIHGCVAGYHSSAGSGVSVCGRTGEWQKATLRCREVKAAISDLRIINERCLRWRTEKEDVVKEIYKVVFRGTREYQGTFCHERRQILHSWDEWVDLCLGLLPATNYTISVMALSTRFTANITTNTSLQVPQAPVIRYRELDTPTATLRLQRSAHTLDAISVYQVVVVPLDGTVVFDCRSRGSPAFSHGGPRSGQYVTGQFPLSDTEMNFTVGDGRFHGGFFNAPLKRGTNYYVILRVVSRWKEAFKSSCVLWAKVTGTSYVMTVASLWAASSVAVLLLVILFGYSYTRFFKMM